MPLIIPEGGSQSLTCSHKVQPIHLVDWYHTADILRPTVDNTARCSCQAVSALDYEGLNFTNFAQSSTNRYSCRALIGAGQPSNSCQFDVLVAGEHIRLHCSAVYMRSIVVMFTIIIIILCSSKSPASISSYCSGGWLFWIPTSSSWSNETERHMEKSLCRNC